MTENTSLERQILLLKIIKTKIDESKNDYIDLFISELQKNKLLNNYNNLIISIESIGKVFKENFSYKIITRQTTVSVLDDPSNPPRMPYIIRIIVENRHNFSDKVVEIEKKSKKKEKVYTFILNKNNQLSLEGSNLPPYEMRSEHGRIKLLQHLAKKKKFISTETLASLFFSGDGMQVRKTIDEIRKEVAEKFGVPRNAIFFNKPYVGYKLDNVKLE